MSTAAAPPRILIADDDRAALELITEILAADGAEVVAVADGRAVLRQALLARFDLVILDAVMPEMNGFEACAGLRKTPFTKDVPVLFLTAYADKATIDQAFAAGATDYLCKPIHPVLLRRRVANLLLLKGLDFTRRNLSEILKAGE